MKKKITNYEIIQLTKELQAAFSNINLDVCFYGDELCFGVDDTPENKAKLEAVIAAHDYNAALIKKNKDECQSKVDKLLFATDFVWQRQEENKYREKATKLSEQDFNAVLDYRQALRDLPNLITTTQKPTYPEPPEFLKEKIASVSI